MYVLSQWDYNFQVSVCSCYPFRNSKDNFSSNTSFSIFKNAYRTANLFNQQQLSVAIKNDYFECENYDRAAKSEITENKTEPAQSRLEERTTSRQWRRINILVVVGWLFFVWLFAVIQFETSFWMSSTMPGLFTDNVCIEQGIADCPKEKYIEKLVFDEKLSFEFRKG